MFLEAISVCVLNFSKKVILLKKFVLPKKNDNSIIVELSKKIFSDFYKNSILYY